MYPLQEANTGASSETTLQTLNSNHPGSVNAQDLTPTPTSGTSSLLGIIRSATVSSKGTKSSSSGIFGRWVSKGVPDTRLIRFAKERRDSLRRKRPSEPPLSPRISSFAFEHQPHIVRAPEDHTPSPPLPNEVPTTKSASIRHERPSLFRSFGKRSSRGSHQSTPDTSHDDTASAASVPTPQSRQSPISVMHEFFANKQRSSEGLSLARMETAQLAKSRRTGFAKVSSDSPTSLKESWLKKNRPGQMHRYHSSDQSSAYSPMDTSEKAIHNPVAEQMVFKATRPPILSSYLSTEARRIKTPPLPNSKLEKLNRTTGYFWNTAPHGAEKLSSDESTSYATPYSLPQHPASLPTSYRKSMERESDWYRVRMDAIMDDEVLPYELDNQAFDWDIPEHLPSSPLCPLNPKHRDGGKGICVYHGRGAGKGRSRPGGGGDLWK
jgi:hypothetical protein